MTAPHRLCLVGAVRYVPGRCRCAKPRTSVRTLGGRGLCGGGGGVVAYQRPGPTRIRSQGQPLHDSTKPQHRCRAAVATPCQRHAAVWMAVRGAVAGGRSKSTICLWRIAEPLIVRVVSYMNTPLRDAASSFTGRYRCQTKCLVLPQFQTDKSVSPLLTAESLLRVNSPEEHYCSTADSP